MAQLSRNDRRLKRHERVRKNVFGTPEKPRMCVYRSNANISVQIIDDVNGVTLASASSIDKELKGEIGYGGNKEAARLAGINTDRVQIISYALSGFFAACAGIIYMGRLNSSVPLAYLEGDSDAIASCIIGGASFNGGKGTMIGTMMGALIIVGTGISAMRVYIANKPDAHSLRKEAAKA